MKLTDKLTLAEIEIALAADQLDGWVWANGFLAPHDPGTGNIGGTQRGTIKQAAAWLKSGGWEAAELPADEVYDEHGNFRD